MKSMSLCYPCFLKQAYSTLAYSRVDEQKRIWVLRELASMLPDLDPKQSPAYNSSLVLFRVHDLSGGGDPYAEERKNSNQMALDMLPGLRQKLDEAGDRLDAAVRLSVVGNIIDLGIQHKASIAETMDSALGEGFAVFEMKEFRKALEASKRILYILDNAGEIVFDMLLIEQLRKTGQAVLAAVRGSPILNDAVMDDAIQVGLDKVCRVIDTGNEFLGVIREKCSSLFLKALDSADLVIAKGQANYESLEGTRPNIFFILKAKCQATADHMGVKEDDLVFKRA
jgi:uncharacterized protein with ATP-grasp and redox domains